MSTAWVAVFLILLQQQTDRQNEAFQMGILVFFQNKVV